MFTIKLLSSTLIICTCLNITDSFANNSSNKENSQVILQKNSGPLPNNFDKVSEMELRVKEIQNEIAKSKEEYNRTNERLFLHDQALIKNGQSFSEKLLEIYLPIFIAVVALAFTYWQQLSTRKHNRLSVEPHIDISPFYDKTGHGLYLDNTGLGPAVIESMELYVDEQLMPEEGDYGGWKKGLKELNLTGDQVDTAWYSKGHFMNSGTNYWAITLKKHDEATKDEIKEFDKTLERINLIIHYKSIYRENFEPASLK